MIHTTYKVTTAPTVEPITLAELKTRLRITVSEFDSELYDLLKQGREQVEYDTHRKLVTQTLAIYYERFPVGEELEIRVLPVASITSVAYIDTAGDAQTFASSSYDTDLDSKPPRVRLASGFSWPATNDEPKAVTVTCVCGEAVDAVPVAAKLAIVEYVKMNWSKCDGDAMTYNNLINTLAWSGVWIAA